MTQKGPSLDTFSPFCYVGGSLLGINKLFIFKICQALQEADVVYAVVGGFAVALHGAVRGTIDIDIAIQWNMQNLQRTELALKKIGLVSQLPISAQIIFEKRHEYINERNLIAWNFYNPKKLSEQIVLIITYDLTGRRVEEIETPLGKVKVLSRKDLIEMKRASARPQDLEDIQALEQLE